MTRAAKSRAGTIVQRKNVFKTRTPENTGMTTLGAWSVVSILNRGTAPHFSHPWFGSNLGSDGNRLNLVALAGRARARYDVRDRGRRLHTDRTEGPGALSDCDATRHAHPRHEESPHGDGSRRRQTGPIVGHLRERSCAGGQASPFAWRHCGASQRSKSPSSNLRGPESTSRPEVSRSVLWRSSPPCRAQRLRPP